MEDHIYHEKKAKRSSKPKEAFDVIIRMKDHNTVFEALLIRDGVRMPQNRDANGNTMPDPDDAEMRESLIHGPLRGPFDEALFALFATSNELLISFPHMLRGLHYKHRSTVIKTNNRGYVHAKSFYDGEQKVREADPLCGL